MKPSGLSIVMPVYNSANYVAEAINRVLSQTFTDFEFLQTAKTKASFIAATVASKKHAGISLHNSTQMTLPFLKSLKSKLVS